MKKKLHRLVSKLLGKNSNAMLIEFWGVRGTLPVSGKKSLRYGGNTNCVTLNFGNKEFLIFDAGTGIKELSNYILKKNQFPFQAKIFISHPHYDHINGIPFFWPLYMPGNSFEIYGMSHSGHNIKNLISGQMDSVYFPVTIEEFGSTISFHTLKEETLTVGDLKIKTILLNHPGKCMGYRVEHQNKSFCYITDNELYLTHHPDYDEKYVDHLIKFIHNADLVVMDTTYNLNEDYLKKLSWGHSCVSRVIDVADKAKVKTLCLYHHDPDQMDKDIDAKLKNAKALLKARGSKTRCIAAKEGQKFLI